ncbi:MAG: GNAT family N-acetyltransferase [Archangium sp.]|nr:GNAT family N-acetyltransferase [Archangium sp.]
MRRPEYAASYEASVAFLEEAETFHLASTTPDGAPVLRTLHGVVDDGWLCFHASPKGEKTELVGRPAVAASETVVAVIPSYFTDPQRACPATTLYRSAQVHGVIQPVEAPERKARVLSGLMTKLQREGGYQPIVHDDPMYRAAVRGLLIAGIPLEREQVTGKMKLAQNKTPSERVLVLEGLWRRGAPGDVAAIEAIRDANPGTPVPEFLRAPDGVSLHPWLPESALEPAVAMLSTEYWNDRFTREALLRAHRGATAWVGARDGDGRLVATARALSDGGKYAWVYDVCVAETHRGRGVGQALMRVLLDHPTVRGCTQVNLGTRDAQSLYARFGFVPRSELPARPYVSTEMSLLR